MAEERVEECGGSQSSLRDRTSKECLYVLFVILVHMCLQISICLVGADLENETRVLCPITTDLLEKSRSSQRGMWHRCSIIHFNQQNIRINRSFFASITRLRVK